MTPSIPFGISMGLIATAFLVWAFAAWIGRKYAGLQWSWIFLPLWWMVLSSVLAIRGVFLDFQGRPPKLLVFLGMEIALIAYTVFFSPIKNRLRSIPQAWILVMQVLRLPLELLLAALAGASLVPLEMTFRGRNFDIVTPFLALGVMALVLKRGERATTRIVWGFNILGTLLACWVVGMGVLSVPTPLQVVHLSMDNIYIGRFPLNLIPFGLVPAAFFLHALSMRKLATETKVKPGEA